MDLSDEEKDCLLTCIFTRIEIINDELTMFKNMKEASLDVPNMVNSYDKLLESYRKEYNSLIRLKNRLVLTMTIKMDLNAL